jgi:hypothetical protein
MRDPRAHARALFRTLRSDGARSTRSKFGLNEKAPTCGAFAEPSDGLEPLTPSLPCAAERLPCVAIGLRRTVPWGERIATVTDTEGNPIALCQQT